MFYGLLNVVGVGVDLIVEFPKRAAGRHAQTDRFRFEHGDTQQLSFESGQSLEARITRVETSYLGLATEI